MKTGRPLQKPFGRVLRRVMEACGVSGLKELAAFLGATEGNVRNWHKRDRVPSDWIVIAEQRSGSDLKDLLSPFSAGYYGGDENDDGVIDLHHPERAAGIHVTAGYVVNPSDKWETPHPVRPDSQQTGGTDPPNAGRAGSAASALLPASGTQDVWPLVLSIDVGQAGRKVNYEVIPKLLGGAWAGTGGGGGGAGGGEANPMLMTLDRAGDLAMSYEWLGRHFHHTTGDLATIQVHGDSMTPTLLDGDTIIIDRGVRDAAIDGIYVIQIRGKRLVKRLQSRMDETLVIISDNQAYERETVPRGRVAEIEVIGRMVWPRVR